MMLSVAADAIVAEALIPIACPSFVDADARFELQEVVAITGRSCVYRAFDRRLDTPSGPGSVAVKVGLKPGESREGILGRRVQHPNVVEVIDRGMTSGGLPYTVLNWVHGPSLDKITVPLPPEESVRLVARLADAVQAAHDAGVVHCDIKPSNVFLSERGVPKLGDFDLALDSADSGQAAGGTLAFMAPEQFRRDPIANSPPTDVYALAALLHYLLTGEPPHGRDHARIALALETGIPARPLKVGDSLRQIVARGLAPERAKRYRTALELAADLQRWLDWHPIPWQRNSPIRRLALAFRRHPLRVGLVAGTALTALGLAIGGAWVHQSNLLASQRELQARLAKQEVELRSTRQADALRLAITALAGSDARRGADDVLPTLAWLDLISFQHLGESAMTLGGWPLITKLREVVIIAEREGAGDSQALLAVRTQILHGLLQIGEFSAAREEFARIPESTWARLSIDDPLAITLRVMGWLAEASDVEAPPAVREAALAALERTRPKLDQTLISAILRRKVDRILASPGATESRGP